MRAVRKPPMDDCGRKSRVQRAYIISPPIVRLFYSRSRLVLLGAMDSRNATSAELVVLDSRPSALSLDLNEKAASSSQLASSSRWSPYLDSAPPTVHSYPARSHRSSCCRASSSVPCSSKLRSWFPIILYAITSFAFIIAIAFYKNQLFQCMCLSALTSPQILIPFQFWMTYPFGCAQTKIMDILSSSSSYF